MLVAGVVQDTFVGEAVEGEGRSSDTFAGEAVQGEGGEEKTTRGYFYCYLLVLLPLRLESLPFPSS